MGVVLAVLTLPALLPKAIIVGYMRVCTNTSALFGFFYSGIVI